MKNVTLLLECDFIHLNICWCYQSTQSMAVCGHGFKGHWVEHEEQKAWKEKLNFCILNIVKPYLLFLPMPRNQWRFMG